jgi:hypothetical protein
MKTKGQSEVLTETGNQKGEVKEAISIMDIYEKLDNCKNKHVFLTQATINLLECTDINDNIISGFQQTAYSLKSEFKELEKMFDVALHQQRLLESAEAGIIITEQGGWQTREIAIKKLKEDINKLNTFSVYINSLREKTDRLMKKAEGLLKEIQVAV